MLERVEVESIRMRPKRYKENYEVPSKDVVKSKTAVWMLAVNEIGIYEALFASRKLEARKFRRWAAEVMRQLRVGVGLKNGEVFRMADPEVQQTIDEWLFENTFAWKIRRSTGETIVTRTDERGDAVYDA